MAKFWIPSEQITPLKIWNMCARLGYVGIRAVNTSNHMSATSVEKWFAAR